MSIGRKFAWARFALCCATLHCSKEESKSIGLPDAPKAETAEATLVSAKTPEAKEYSFDVAASKISFTGYNVTVAQQGHFAAWTGTLAAPGTEPAGAAATIEIDLASITTPEARLTQHLKSADFFDVAKYPKARFTSTKIESGGSAGATHTVHGNLELHGVTKSIRFPASFQTTPTQATMTAKFMLDRQAFGIAYVGAQDNLIRDLVLIELSVVAKNK